jgi:hypothetical protein
MHTASTTSIAATKALLAFRGMTQHCRRCGLRRFFERASDRGVARALDDAAVSPIFDGETEAKLRLLENRVVELGALTNRIAYLFQQDAKPSAQPNSANSQAAISRSIQLVVSTLRPPRSAPNITKHPKRRELDTQQRRAATAALLIQGFGQRTWTNDQRTVVWRTAAEPE